MERSGTARQPQLLGQKKDKFWLTVGLCALTAALFFLPFYIIDGGFFHYAGDFNSQQISFYRYMNGFIKGAGYPDSAFTSVHNTFSWATDLGSGVMNAYSFYLYGSPFFWFSLLFPQGWLPYLMVPLLVLKFAVAGGGAYLYLRRYVKNIDYAVLGACLYTFSGFTVYNVFFNHFVDVVALFPYLLWSLDEALYNDRRSWFAFWVAVNLVNNYFFFIGQVVFLAIYFICKLSTRDFRLTAKKFGLLAFESAAGRCHGQHPAGACGALHFAEPAHHRPFLRLGLSDLQQGAAVPCNSRQLDHAAGFSLPHIHLVGGRDQVDQHVGLSAAVQSGRCRGLLESKVRRQ